MQEVPFVAKYIQNIQLLLDLKKKRSKGIFKLNQNETQQKKCR